LSVNDVSPIGGDLRVCVPRRLLIASHITAVFPIRVQLGLTRSAVAQGPAVRSHLVDAGGLDGTPEAGSRGDSRAEWVTVGADAYGDRGSIGAHVAVGSPADGLAVGGTSVTAS
jgi:hypothetical protein